MNRIFYQNFSNPVRRGLPGMCILSALSLVFFACLVAAPAPLFAQLSMLHASGTNIVNANGSVVPLRGVNLGGWFIMEKWMAPLDSTSDPQTNILPDTYSVMQMLDNRFGVAEEQSLIRSYQQSWITTTDLDNIQAAGFNVVRVPVWWGQFYPLNNVSNASWRSDAFTELDWLVSNCASRGIYVIIDMHGVVGGQSNSDDTGQANQNQYWTNGNDQGNTAFMWWQIASHYNGNSTIAGYDLINEPSGAPSSSAVWSAYSSLYNTIRSTDPGHMLIMEGTWGSWNWSMLPAPSQYGWTNIAYSMHEYQSKGSTSQVEAGSDNQVNDFYNHSSWNVPGYIGEFNDFYNDSSVWGYSINAYNTAGLSWTMWSYKATNSLNPNFWGFYGPTYWAATPSISTDSAATILSDWQQWTTPATFAANGSIGVNGGGANGCCGSGVTEGPYGGNPAAIPGTVMNENYDTGGQSVGYSVSSTNGTDNGYRSDGVDLETASAPATGNDVGWSSAGQWFHYTVNVSTAGTYTVSFLVAGGSGAAVTDAFHLSNSSGTNLTGSVAVPATGGWQTWTTVTATLTLPAGVQTLTLNQDNGGWNIDSMAFASSGGVVAGAWYNIINQNSGSCVDDAGWGTANGTFVQQYACGNQQYNQEWQFIATSNGYYSVINRNAAAQNEVWDVTGGPGATTPGTPIQTWSNGKGTNEQWKPVAMGNGYYTFQVLNSGMCLDTPSASTANGVQLDAYTCNNTAAQSFKLSQQP